MDFNGDVADGTLTDGVFVSVVGVVTHALIPKVIVSIMIKIIFRIRTPFTSIFRYTDFIA